MEEDQKKNSFCLKAGKAEKRDFDTPMVYMDKFSPLRPKLSERGLSETLI